MAETDDIVARLHELAAVLGQTFVVDPVKLARFRRWEERNATERDAQIERLTRERNEAIREMSEWATKAGEAEGRLKASEWHGVVEGWQERATTAERERDEARAEVERLRELFRSDGEQHAQFVKTLTEAHEVRITKYADAFNEMRTDVERKDAALLRVAKRCPRPDLVARAALTKGGENGQS